MRCTQHIHGRLLPESVLLRPPAIREDGLGQDIRAGDFVLVGEGEHAGTRGVLMGFTLLRSDPPEGAGVLTEQGIEIEVPAEHLTRLPGGQCRRCAGTGIESSLWARNPRRCKACRGRGVRVPLLQVPAALTADELAGEMVDLWNDIITMKKKTIKR